MRECKIIKMDSTLFYNLWIPPFSTTHENECIDKIQSGPIYFSKYEIEKGGNHLVEKGGIHEFNIFVFFNSCNTIACWNEQIKTRYQHTFESE